MVQSTSDIGADVIPEPDHRRSRGLEKGSRKRQQPGSRDHREHNNNKETDPKSILVGMIQNGEFDDMIREGLPTDPHDKAVLLEFLRNL